MNIELTEKADLRCIEAAREANDRCKRPMIDLAGRVPVSP